ncbi:ABC transporter permease [Corynebacterium frankenforstense DSM 45800]|uniref:ABC transporter permease n=1 Tax=Corynebacterium frankenforstense DSM 45800 TaxID=1437875 RepID=A0A1L7CS25_9CORY|nr:ABC transporter permease [Corynebacterium frankenforstense DSM 45800]
MTGLRLRELIGPVTAGTATMLASIALTVVSAWLITKAWQRPFVMDVMVAVTAVRALGISRALLRYVERLSAHRLALGTAGRTRVGAYRLLAAGDPRKAMGLGSGALLTRLGEDVDEVADVIVRAVVPVGTAVVTGAVSVVFVLFVSPAAALVLAVGLVAAAVVPPWLVARGVRVAEDRRAAAGEAYTAEVDQVLSGSAALRVRGELDGALARADAAARERERATEAGAPALAWAAGAQSWIHGLTVLGVILLAGSLYLADGHSPQWLGVLVLLALAAFEATGELPAAAETLTRAAGAARRIAAFAEGSGASEEGSAADGSVAEGALAGGAVASGPRPPAEPDVVARGLVVGFDTDVATWDLEAPFGSFREIVAPSGYGKTTLLLTLAGLLPPRGGTVIIGGLAPADYPAHELRRGVFFTPEDAHVFATTVRDNLAVGAAGATDAQMHQVLEAVGLEDWVAGLPRGLATILDSGAESLSDGQRRRLLIARALLTDSPVLLLDEPTEHLDPASSAAMLEMLSSGDLPGARARRTVIVVRHPRTR